MDDNLSEDNLFNFNRFNEDNLFDFDSFGTNNPNDNNYVNLFMWFDYVFLRANESDNYGSNNTLDSNISELYELQVNNSNSQYRLYNIYE